MFWLFSPYKGLVIDTDESSTPNCHITHNTVKDYVAKPERFYCQAENCKLRSFLPNTVALALLEIS